MSQTMMALYGVYDVPTGTLVGVAPVTGQISNISGQPVTITGTAQVGNTLTATLATGWSATSFQWTRDGTNISGATSQTYTLISADQTHLIACTVSGLSSKATGVTP